MFTQKGSLWFICFILPLFSNNYLTSTNATIEVTETLIGRICINTRNTSLCKRTFEPFKLQTIREKPFTTLVSLPIILATNAASELHYNVRRLSERTNKETRKGYEQCIAKTFIIKNKTKTARLYMLRKNKMGFRFNIADALRKSIEVHKTLTGLPEDQLKSEILNEVVFLRDVLDIIVALCDKLPYPT